MQHCGLSVLASWGGAGTSHRVKHDVNEEIQKSYEYLFEPPSCIRLFYV